MLIIVHKLLSQYTTLTNIYYIYEADTITHTFRIKNSFTGPLKRNLTESTFLSHDRHASVDNTDTAYTIQKTIYVTSLRPGSCIQLRILFNLQLTFEKLSK